MNRRSGARMSLVLVWCAVACCFGLSGCANFMDDLTAHGENFDAKVHRIFGKDPDPVEVLTKSQDGTLRARAFHKLVEPAQHGGSEKDQDWCVNVLNKAACEEVTAPARMAAIQTLGGYKDPRVIKGLEDAYYQASRNVTPEVASVIRCQCLEALGATRQPEAVNLLTKVLKSPPIDKNASEADRQHDIDERCAAVRSLGYFQGKESTTALLGVLQKSREGALRGEARMSLCQVTGADLPEDAKAWEAYLQDPNAHPPSLAEKLLNEVVPVSFRPGP